MNIPLKFVLYVTGALVCVELRSILLNGKLMRISAEMLLFAVVIVFIVFVITGGRPR